MQKNIAQIRVHKRRLILSTEAVGISNFAHKLVLNKEQLGDMTYHDMGSVLGSYHDSKAKAIDVCCREKAIDAYKVMESDDDNTEKDSCGSSHVYNHLCI